MLACFLSRHQQLWCQSGWHRQQDVLLNCLTADVVQYLLFAVVLASQVGYFHAFIDGVDFVFVDHPSFHARSKDIYGGERQEIQFRCALLCKAALESVWHVPCGGVSYGDNNTVFIANDWHTALLPVYLQVGKPQLSWWEACTCIQWPKGRVVAMLWFGLFHGNSVLPRSVQGRC